MKVGDTIKVISDVRKNVVGLKGVVVHFDREPHLNVGVDFGVDFGGNDLGGRIKTNTGRWFDESQVKVVRTRKK